MNVYKKLLFIFAVLYLIRNYFYRQFKAEFFHGDFSIYYNFTKYGDRHEWLYKDYISIIWKPFTSIPFDTAFIVWYILSSVCVLILVWKLLEIGYGWILVFPCIKVAGWSLGVGNIMPFLAIGCLTPLGCLACGMVKPYLLCFMAVHAIIRFNRGKESVALYDEGR